MPQIEHLKLYHFPMSRSARVKWLLHEIRGTDFEVVRMALYQGEQYRPAALARNPNHAVPVLEITTEAGETFTMIESTAMISFLADLHPEKHLAPPPQTFSAERLDYLQLLHFLGTSMDMMLWQLRLQHDLVPDAERDAHTIRRYEDKIRQEVEPQLLARLDEHDHMLGDAFSAADCLAGHNIMWAGLYGLCQDDRFGDYLARLAVRPAYREAFADRHEFTAKP